MHIFAGVAGSLLILFVLWDAFETIVLPRRVTRRFRLARLFYRSSWQPWRFIASRKAPKRRENLLAYFGPLSLLLLLLVWAVSLIFGYAMLHWAIGSRVVAADGTSGFWTDFYMSGTTFFTLGLGDVTPKDAPARALTVLEGGMGFGFLALLIGYLPVIYQQFSRREANISLLDARAGSPPTAGELLRRHAYDDGMEALRQLLADWERWAAELMESHLSYPVLCYYRSQHNNQSWLGSLTAILDTCAMVIVGVEGSCQRQAELTFAIARHAVVDLAQIFGQAPSTGRDRLDKTELLRLRAALAEAGLRLREGEEADHRLGELRSMYEPYVNSLGRHLLIEPPPWMPEKMGADNWQTSAWGRSTGFAVSSKLPEVAHDEHL